MLADTHKKGEIAFLKVALRAAEKGMILSRPTTEARYDAILDDGKKLIRVQVKYTGGDGKPSGIVRADFRKKSNTVAAQSRTYTSDEIDMMLVYVPAIDQVLMFKPAEFAGKSTVVIRLQPPKNGQKIGVILAADHVW